MIEKLRKRRFYPVTIGDATVHLRGLLYSEHETAEEFGEAAESWGYAIGCCLMHDDGTEWFTRMVDVKETASDFGARVLRELDLPDDTRAELIAAIVKLSQGPPKIETLAKN